ncbi:MAG: hypothetical protein O6952_05655 [Planctomycetota bacterium]|nr:hypothetical protein [Planctomycetota bacterium]
MNDRLLRMLGIISMLLILVACNKSSGSSGNGGVPITGDVHEPNENRTSCSPVVLDFSETMLTLHSVTDQDYYCFTVGLPSDLTATATFDPAMGDIQLELQDSVGTVLALGQAQPTGPDLMTTVTCGTFHVRVFSPTQTLNNYSLAISAVATVPPGIPDANEPDDDPTMCTLLTDPRFGVISVPGHTLHDGLNEDWFCFPLGGTADIEILIISLGPINSLAAELLDSSLNVIASGLLFDAIIPSGDYFVRIYPINCSRSSYFLEVSEI